MKQYPLYTLWLFFAIISLTFSSCRESEDNTPSLADRDRMEELIDNSNADIVEFKQKYGTYILYEFDDLLDFAYQFEEASAWREATVTHLDKADVQAALEFLQGGENKTENAFLNCYNDQMISNYFPRKLLICKSIASSDALGYSTPVGGLHTAVANLNSMTIAGLDAASLSSLNTEAKRTQYFRQLNYILLANYIVNARGELFVDNTFFEHSKTYYNTLIDESRKQAREFQKTGDETIDAANFYAKFYDRGLFYPLEGDEETYYDSATEDLVSYLHELIFMDEALATELERFSMMNDKMQLVARSLQEMGVDVEMINEIAAQHFLNN